MKSTVYTINVGKLQQTVLKYQIYLTHILHLYIISQEKKLAS